MSGLDEKRAMMWLETVPNRFAPPLTSLSGNSLVFLRAIGEKG